LENENPTVFGRSGERIISLEDEDDFVHDAVDAREVFDHIRNINDPEHPLTLEELNVVDESHIKVDDCQNEVIIEFTPTIPHCSMATLIGLCIRVKLLRTLPSRFKVDVVISPGTHVSETAINKQLADKERVAAAIENTSLLSVLNQCLATSS
jgi:metal-sulfur cluster biosynthetic enzyme